MSDNKQEPKKLHFRVQDVPPVPTAILLGIQQILVCASGVISAPLVVSDLLCAGTNALARVKLVGTTLFVTGFSTIVQSTFGVRLPLMQGPSFAFFAPVIALMKLPEYRCPNLDNLTASNFSQDEMDEMWMSRMTIVQGGLMTAAAVEALIGLTGLVGIITKFVGPLTIAPLMIGLELSVIQVCLQYCAQHWSSVIAMLTLMLTVLYLNDFKSPMLTFSRKKKCHVKMFPVFAIFPYLIAICVVWALCGILSASGAFNDEADRPARTDVRAHVIVEAPWFRWPYPGQWGPVQFKLGVFLGMTAAAITSLVEDIGSYHVAARVCDERPPPAHVMNRGILMEGICCIFGGSLGGSVSVTTYSENIGVIGITKVASRLTTQVAGVLYMFLGVFTKFGALLATIPDPIIGGILTISLSIVGGVGISTLHAVDLQSTRNTSILGIAIMLGALIPAYVEKYPIVTGSETFNGLINMLLGLQIFVSGIIGFILDNTVPGATPEQRGLKHASINSVGGATTYNVEDPYTFPPFVMKVLEKIPCSRYIPFLPTSECTSTQSSVKDVESRNGEVTKF